MWGGVVLGGAAWCEAGWCRVVQGGSGLRSVGSMGQVSFGIMVASGDRYWRDIGEILGRDIGRDIGETLARYRVS